MEKYKTIVAISGASTTAAKNRTTKGWSEVGVSQISKGLTKSTIWTLLIPSLYDLIRLRGGRVQQTGLYNSLRRKFYILILTHHFCNGVKDLHLLENGCSVICNGDITTGALDLYECACRNILNDQKISLTILSIPRGPRLVRTASATAVPNHQ